MRKFLAATGCLALWCCCYAAIADDAPRSITIDVVIASGARNAAADEMTPAALAELEKAGKLDWVTRMRLATVENDRAQVQVGERTSMVTGRMQRGGFPGAGGETAALSFVNIGTTIEAIPQVAEDGSIVVALTVEKSWLEPATASVAEGVEGPPPPPPPARTRNLTAKATVTVQSGEPTLVMAQASSAGKDQSQFWIILTARAAQGSKRVAQGEAPALTVFSLKFVKATDAGKVIETVLGKLPIRIAVEERLNSVLIHAPPETTEKVRALLTLLDVEGPQK
jgi:type II secretory pathway component GspD/PulD (secretin)